MGNVIDFGLIVLILLQIGLVLGSYHFWQAAKNEAARINKVDTRISELTSLLQAAERKVEAVEAIPKSLLTRIDKLESGLDQVEREKEKLSEKVVSLAAKYSAVSRWSKKENQETDLAPQGDMEQELIFPAEPDPQKTVSPNFGVMPGKRKVING